MAHAALVASIAGCGAGRAQAPEESVEALRRTGRATTDPSVAGRWLLAELTTPGGDPKAAVEARRRLDELGAGDLRAALARGIDDSLHGRLAPAVSSYLRAVELAATSSDPSAPLIAWFATDEVLALEPMAPDAWKTWQPVVERLLDHPGNMGWRARASLVEWWANEAHASATRDVEELAAARYGCVKNVRLAGPFGRNAPTDALRGFAAELPGPWPYRWQPEPLEPVAPKVLATSRHGCTVEADEATPGGIFYGETFVEVDRPRDVVVSVQGALAVWIDDVMVLDRDSRVWGVWPNYGVRVELAPGRHRVLARLSTPSTNVRVLRPDGAPANVSSSTDAAPGYSLVAPRVGPNPNDLMRFIRPDGVVAPPDETTRFVAAYLAHVEGQDDVASILLEPLVKDPKAATGPALSTAAVFARNDPIFGSAQTEDLVRELQERAVKKDPDLWAAQLDLALGEARRKGATEAVPRLRNLGASFPGVPAVLGALARLYGELGWQPEHDDTISTLLDRFPSDLETLFAAVDLYDARGRDQEADRLVERILELDADSEIRLTRALAREDYVAALTELERLAKRRPDRKDLAERVHDVMVRAGNTAETWKKLESAIENAPTEGAPRLELADAQYAAGQRSALRTALARSTEAGADTSTLRYAIDLVEGMTELDSYRLDARQVIRDYEASGTELAGTAARVLDYMAVWVRSDGSSKLLEHEVVRIQSKEAIDAMAEHQRLPGLVLHMRVIKQDGRTLEPEFVAGKPTVTLPHLEVGDYIETEQIITAPGDGRGLVYDGPRWFFREQNVAYARSEFIHVAPKHRNLIVETRGNVPEPQVTDLGHSVLRRWRVDASPAAPVEPHSAPVQEYLPSVQVGWGISLDERIRRIADAVTIVTPVDPRIRRVARRIADVDHVKPEMERARRLYRWILANVEEGEETDGRKVVIGKNGNRWKGFIELCRSLDIAVDYAIARNRLTSPAIGPLSESTQFSDPILRVGTDAKSTWLTVSSKFAPFGYVPAEVREVPAFLLEAKGPRRVTTPATGERDAIEYGGTAKLSADGSAKLDLEQRFHGKFAMGLRATFAQLPQRQILDVLESRLLGRALRGARLEKYDLVGMDDLDAPLVIRMTASMQAFAQQSGSSLVLAPPFAPKISQLAVLPSRETPLLIGEASHQTIRIAVELPPGARIDGSLAPREITHGEYRLHVRDGVEGGVLRIERGLDLPAGRVQPDDYPAFLDFARRADEAMSRSVRITVP